MAKKQTSKKQRAKARAEAQKKKQQQRYMFMGLGALLLFSLIGFSVFRNATAPDPLTPSVIDAGSQSDDGIFLQNYDGSPDAPVQIMEFGDFGCHACRGWHNAGIKDQIKEKYGDQVAFVFRHFPVITRNSPQAAAAGQCAAEQDMFWEYHDYIYESTPEGALAKDDLTAYAQTVGLDMGQFETCFESGKYESYVSRDLNAAQKSGARGTPTFFVNGQQEIPSFQNLSVKIDAILNG